MAKNSGFTLIEVLIAVFVFSIGLLGLMQLQHVTWKLLIQSEQTEKQ